MIDLDKDLKGQNPLVSHKTKGHPNLEELRNMNTQLDIIVLTDSEKFLNMYIYIYIYCRVHIVRKHKIKVIISLKNIYTFPSWYMYAAASIYATA